MKKLFAIVMMASLSSALPAQYMIIGKDSISLPNFKAEYQYGLQNSGVEKTIKTTQDFLLLQQFAEEKKADTTASFREKMSEKISELQARSFYPKSVIEPVLTNFLKDNQTEKEVQIFILPKTAEDKTDYQQVYNDVKSGKMTMDEAITKYTKGSAKAVYIKPGIVDNDLYAELKTLSKDSYTKILNTSNYVAFAKVLNSRPSLGYLIFGTISFPKDANSETIKTKIYADLKAGKTFQDVAKIYGANENEKQNGGVVMGSPTLPDEVYALFQGKKSNYYTPQPLLFGESYFIFNLYNVEPYILTEKNRDFFLREMNNTIYAEILQDKMLAYLKSDPTYKEFPEFQNVKKSYQNLDKAKDATVLYQYKNHKITVADLKKVVSAKKEEAEKLSPALSSDALSGVNNQDLMEFYTQDFTLQPAIKKELSVFKKGLYSDYIFSKYLTEEITKHPEIATAYYNKNKEKFFWDKRADGRVAIIADQNLNAEIEKAIKDPKNWETLKAKYYGKLNDKKQILVNFEKGEMSEDADVFTKYKVPFKVGVYQTNMESRSLVIAIDQILAPSQMTQAEAADLLKDAVTEEKLQEIIAVQRAKTKIVVEPAFVKDLEKNFKK